MKQTEKKVIMASPDEFFHRAISGAFLSLNVKASNQAKSYLVNLLSYFISTENLYPKDKENEETLALQFLGALQENNTEYGRHRFRQLGDFSLYIAGFFSESLEDKAVDTNYYIEMGSTAYKKAAQPSIHSSQAELFEELSKKFSYFVDIFGQVSVEIDNKQSNASLLQSYDLWKKTGSSHLAKKLTSVGIVMNKENKKEKKQ